jgi:polysaccharide biosynthesis protein PslH
VFICGKEMVRFISLNILVLTPLIPYPPHDGDKLRLYHFLSHLKKRGHKIDLFCVTRVKDDLRYASDLQPLCRRVYTEHINNWDLFFNLLGGLLIGQSLNVSSHFSPKLRDVLKAYWQTPEGQKINVVLAHRLRMAPAAFDGYFNQWVGFKNRPIPDSTPEKIRKEVNTFFQGSWPKPVVLEMTDCLTSYTKQIKEQRVGRFSRRIAALWDYWFLRREEIEWSELAFQSIVISEPDAQVLREEGAPADKVTVIPNGVEVKRVAKAKRAQVYPTKAPVVCFVGNMGYPPNEDGALWFLKKIWPLVKREVPQAVFAAVGGQPRKTLRKFHNGQDVLVTGWVPEIEPYLLHANLSVAPLRVTAGMQNKVALALSLGVPVVATPGAVGWMPPKGRDGVIVAEGPEMFAQEVVQALRRPVAAKAAAKKGQRFILRNYKWNESGKKLEEILKKAAKSSRPHI